MYCLTRSVDVSLCTHGEEFALSIQAQDSVVEFWRTVRCTIHKVVAREAVIGVVKIEMHDLVARCQVFSA